MRLRNVPSGASGCGSGTGMMETWPVSAVVLVSYAVPLFQSAMSK